MASNPRCFGWRGLRDGAALTGRIWAPDEISARLMLLQEGVHHVRLRRQWNSAKGSGSALTRSVDQWATLLQSGVRVVPALQLLSQQELPNRLIDAWQRTARAVASGAAVHEALSRHPDVFSPTALALVRAGELSGRLPEMLRALAQAMRQQELLQRRVQTALRYPMAVLGVAVLAVLFMMAGVIPVFEEVFKSMNAPLPPATQALLDLRHHFVEHGWLWLLAMGTLVATAQRAWRSPRFKEALQKRVMAWPWAGKVWQTLLCARWSHTLHTLLDAGVPLTQALPVAAQSCGVSLYQKIGEHLQRRVQAGDRLSQAMADTQRFPALLTTLCATGEETGTLSVLLGQAAQLLQEDTQERLDQMTAWLEPLTVLGLGVAIGGILVAMYLPIFQVGQAF